MEEANGLKGERRDAPPREVHTNPDNSENIIDITNIEEPEPDRKANSTSAPPEENATGSTEIDVDSLKNDDNMFQITRLTDPWKKERVDEILKQLKIETDLTEGECECIQKFVAEWADIFALSDNEVKQVDKAVHFLDIPPGTKFSTKTGQRPLTPLQRKLYESIDTMLNAGIIEQCSLDQVKCVSPTTLAQKAHSSSGLNIKYLLDELYTYEGDHCDALNPFYSIDSMDQYAGLQGAVDSAKLSWILPE